METNKRTPDAVDAEVKVPCEVYSRVVGYLRPVVQWNHGKKEEFKDRKEYATEKKS